MMCDNCGQRQATIFLTKVVNGEKNEMHLCKKCAEEGENSFFEDISLVNILANLAGNTPRVRQPEETLVCPNCGFSIERFRREGRVGCEQCYRHFAAELMPVMRKIHGSLQHTGKRPGVAARQAAAPETEEAMHMADLRKRLQAAIKGEEYEKAALLRDEIRALEAAAGGAAK